MDALSYLETSKGEPTLLYDGSGSKSGSGFANWEENPSVLLQNLLRGLDFLAAPKHQRRHDQENLTQKKIN